MRGESPETSRIVEREPRERRGIQRALAAVMTPTAQPFAERLWWAAHAAPWFPGWAAFQILAMVLGAALVVREGGRRLAGPFALGCVLAVAGALVLGSGAEWLDWVGRGARGRSPDIEVAGFGALAGLVLGHVLGARARGLSLVRALDALAPAVGMMLMTARVGCFFAGCDFGSPSRLPWALHYPAMTPAFRAQVEAGLIAAGAARTLAVHPTQLYESAAGLVVLWVALGLRTRRGGARFAVSLAMLAAARIITDTFRGDLARGGSLGLTTTQGLSLAVAGAIIAWWGLATPGAATASSLSGGGVGHRRDDRPSSRGSRRSSPPRASS